MITDLVPNIPATVINPGSPNQMVMGFNTGMNIGPSVNRLPGIAGLGMASTTGTDEDTRGIMDGMKLWTSPTAAFQALNRIALGTDKAPITYTVGAALPPLIAVGILLTLVGGGGGRRR